MRCFSLDDSSSRSSPISFFPDIWSYRNAEIAVASINQAIGEEVICHYVLLKCLFGVLISLFAQPNPAPTTVLEGSKGKQGSAVDGRPPTKRPSLDENLSSLGLLFLRRHQLMRALDSFVVCKYKI